MPVNTTITLRKGTATQWNVSNPILALGEPGFDTTNGVLKIGDGVQTWNNLLALNNKGIKSTIYPTGIQSTFNVSGGYVPGSLDVFYNGTKLISDADYVATNGSSFTLTNPAVSGSVIEYLGLLSSVSYPQLSNTQFRTDTTLGWVASNPILTLGEAGYDTTAQSLKIGDGVTPWNSLQAVNSNYRSTKGVFNTTTSQIVFSIPGGYTSGAIDIYLNGVKLLDGVDYIATNGLTVSMTQPIPSGNVVEYRALASITGNAYTAATDQYSATISRDIIDVTTNNLSGINIAGGYDVGGIDIYQNGSKLVLNRDFTAVDGTSVNFNNPPPSGAVIEYVSFISGRSRRSINTITSSVVAAATSQTDYIYVATSPSLTVTMPSAIGNNNRYTIKNLSNGPLYVVPQAGQTIDNQAIISILNQYISIDLVSDNQNWIII